MPIILAFILTALGSFVVRLLLALGIGFTTYIGFDALMSQVLAYMDARLAGLPATITEFLTSISVPQCISIVVAGLTTRVSITGLRRLVLRAAAP